MNIQETTPHRVRTFKMDVNETELSEMNIAFTHMLDLVPQWYCNDQKEKVTVMRDKIRALLGAR